MRGGTVMKKLFVLLVCLLAIVPVALAQTLTSGDYQYTLTEDHEAVITGYTGAETVLIIPASLDGYPVIGLGNRSFSGTAVERVTVPEGVREIQHMAFAQTPLQEVSLPSTLRYLGSGVFNDTPMTTLVLPEGLEELACAPVTNRVLETYVWPYSLKKVNVGTYSPSVLEPDIPADHPCFMYVDGMLIDKTTMTLVGYQNKRPDSALTIPEGVRRLGAHAIDDAYNLKSLTLPSTLEVIESDAIVRSNIQELVLPEGLQKIASGGINRNAVDAVVLPHLSIVIEEGGLGGAPFSVINTEPGLMRLEDGMLIHTAEKRLVGYTPAAAKSRVTLPAGIESIDALAFARNTTIVYLTIPEGVKRIGSNAFYSCDNLVSVTFPSPWRALRIRPSISARP